MNMFASDGLPKSYYRVTDNKSLMIEMKALVFTVMDSLEGNTDAKEVCSIAGIDIIFESEVEDFMHDWETQ